MSALDVIAAVGGLCGAVALARQFFAAWAERQRRLAALDIALSEWAALPASEQALAREDMKAWSREAATLPPDAESILASIRRLSQAFERQPPRSAGHGVARPFSSTARVRSQRSAADLLRDARLALQGPAHD